jgi:hypothetical protein
MGDGGAGRLLALQRRGRFGSGLCEPAYRLHRSIYIKMAGFCLRRLARQDASGLLVLRPRRSDTPSTLQLPSEVGLEARPANVRKPGYG